MNLRLGGLRLACTGSSSSGGALLCHKVKRKGEKKRERKERERRRKQKRKEERREKGERNFETLAVPKRYEHLRFCHSDLCDYRNARRSVCTCILCEVVMLVFVKIVLN